MKVPEGKKKFPLRKVAVSIIGALTGVAIDTAVWKHFEVVRPVLGVTTSRTCDFVDTDPADDYVMAFCLDGTVWSAWPEDPTEAVVAETLQPQ